MAGKRGRPLDPRMLADTNLSVALNTNLLSAAILPLRLCTSFMFLGCAISIMARILSRLASIPL